MAEIPGQRPEPKEVKPNQTKQVELFRIEHYEEHRITGNEDRFQGTPGYQPARVERVTKTRIKPA